MNAEKQRESDFLWLEVSTNHLISLFKCSCIVGILIFKQKNVVFEM